MFLFIYGYLFFIVFLLEIYYAIYALIFLHKRFFTEPVKMEKKNKTLCFSLVNCKMFENTFKQIEKNTNSPTLL